jgi:hypothetical protein
MMSYSKAVTALEAYDLTTKGGGGDFATVVAACESLGPYCLIGGLAVNCYVEPVYTLDADIVVIAHQLSAVSERLRQQGFVVETHPHSVNVRSAGSELRIQFTTDERYQAFLARSEEREVLGRRVRVACLQDVAQGKLWAYDDPQRRLSKRKKDELDLIRLAEAYPTLKSMYPRDLLDQLEEI